MRSTHKHPQPSVVQLNNRRLYRPMIPTYTLMMTATFMFRSYHGIGAGPAQAVVIRHISIAPFGRYSSMRGHNNALPRTYKHRWFDHNGWDIRYLTERTVALLSANGTNTVDSVASHIHNPYKFAAYRRLYIRHSHTTWIIYTLPCHAAITARDIKIAGCGLFSIVVMPDFSIRHSGQPYIRIRRTGGHDPRAEYRLN